MGPDLGDSKLVVGLTLQRDVCAFRNRRELVSHGHWIDADDVTIPGFGESLPAGARELAQQSGFGISTHGRWACVYTKGNAPGSWPSDIEGFVPRALAVVDAL